MNRLVSCYPTLSPHIIKGPTGRPTVNWADPAAVRALNTALLVADYNINPSYSDILPQDALVPPIPGRADYVHHIADLLQNCTSNAKIPKGSGVIGFDIGTGSSCIYATIAASVYGWRMIASDINTTSLESARKIVNSNVGHDDLIDLRHQHNKSSIFDGILEQDERIDFCMCNPPFYHNREEFVAENTRKLKGLAKSRGQLKKAERIKVATANALVVEASSNNFGGIESELIYNGGEVRFVKQIFNESKMYWDRTIHQHNKSSIFDGILEQDERIDFCMCNPPFYHNREEFVAENTRKLKGLAKSRGQLKKAERIKVATANALVVEASSNNFGGIESELIYNGGEVRFVKQIFNESKMYWDRCLWFTTLVSRNDNLKKIKSYMREKKKRRRKTRKGDREIKMIDQIPIGAGKKKSNILIWTFMDEDERRHWARSRNWNQ